MKFTSSFLYALALLFAMATVRAQLDCKPVTDNIDIDAQGSDDDFDFVTSDSYAVEKSC